MLIGERTAISTRRIWIAWTIAVAADLVQIAIFPYFFEGLLSPVNAALDVVAGITLILLVGWHIAFLPGFVIEMVPFADLAPTWTLAVFIATRGRSGAGAANRPGLPVPTWKKWYDGLVKPKWTPAPSTIRVIWTVLYPIIVITYGFVFVQTVRGRLPWSVDLPFGINLAANLIFTPILFGLRNLKLASLDILIVLGTIPWAIVVIWPHYPLIGVAQVPYLAWTSIATVLQVSITLMNRRTVRGL